MNPENDLKYGTQNFGKNSSGYYVVLHAINNIMNGSSKKTKVNNSFFEQILLLWQANNVRFLPLQDPLRTARLPTASPKMVSAVPRKVAVSFPLLWPYQGHHATLLAKIITLRDYCNKRTAASKEKKNFI